MKTVPKKGLVKLFKKISSILFVITFFLFDEKVAFGEFKVQAYLYGPENRYFYSSRNPDHVDNVIWGYEPYKDTYQITKNYDPYQP